MGLRRETVGGERRGNRKSFQAEGPGWTGVAQVGLSGGGVMCEAGGRGGRWKLD